MNRRQLISLLGGAAAWPLAARAQQPAMPVIGYLGTAELESTRERMAAFRRSLGDAGYVEGRNVAIEYRWAENQIDRLPAMAADLVRRHVNILVTPNSMPAALAAKAATATIPIVFSTASDPVQFGLVASLNRTGTNTTGVFYISGALAEKRLGLLHELLPRAGLVAALVNPDNPTSKPARDEVQDAARVLGLKIEFLDARSSQGIDVAFVTLVRRRADALLLINDTLFTSRRVQIVILAARHAIPAVYTSQEYAEVGGLMSYGTNLADVYRQIGTYTGRILDGTKPADLPVIQPTKFELVINLQTARPLGLNVPNALLATADEVIE